MKSAFLYFSITCICTCLSTRVFSQLVITENNNAMAVAQKLLGEGVIISNASLTQSTVAIPSGYFNNLGGTNLELDSGIVLSTGRVKSNYSVTPNLRGMDGDGTYLAGWGSDASNTNLGLPGDVDIASIFGFNVSTLYDAVSLEFDFIPLGDSIKFEYIFSSEEYTQSFVCNYNDPFAFLLSGPGIIGKKNIALVPNTNTPVSVTNVNYVLGAGCINNQQYYVDNYANTQFVYVGHTKVFTAKSVVQPCQTYHLKIVIADARDFLLDSGVFLKAGSLTSNSVKIDNKSPLDNGVPYVVEGCNIGGINIYRSKKLPTPQNVTLNFFGSAINGIDVQTIPLTVTIPANDSVVSIPIIPVVDNLPEGIEKLKIYVSLGCVNTSIYSDSITIDVRDYDTLSILPKDSIGICKGTSVPLIAAPGFATYTWNNSATLSVTNIRNPIALPTQARTTYICTADQGNCHAKDSIVIQMRTIDLLNKVDVACLGASTGQILVSGGWEWARPVQYSINNGAYQLDSLFTGLPVGTYKLKIKDVANCMDSITVVLALTSTPLAVNGVAATASCNGDNGSVVLNATNGLLPYLFSMDGVNYSANTNYTSLNAGNYTIYAKDGNGCIDSKPISIVKDPVISFTASTTPASCSGNADGSITASATGGNTQYIYSLDGINFQTSNILPSTTGNKIVTVKDIRGCITIQPVIVPLNNTVIANGGGNPTICEGTYTTIAATSNGTTFSWLPTANLNNPSLLNPVASPTSTTIYTLTATTGICTQTTSVAVNVLPAPIPNAGIDTTICFGNNATLHGFGGTLFNWTPPTYLMSSTAQHPIVQNPPTGDIVYSLRVEDAAGCKSLIADDVKVTTLPPAKLFVGNDTSIAMNQPLQLKAIDINAIGFVNYSWSPTTGLNNSLLQNPITTLINPQITYTVTATTASGCIGFDDIKIKTFKGPEIYVPNSFTPNSDGLNDVLKAIPIGMKEFHYLKIYNRYGQLIFQTPTELKGWDGMFKNNKQPLGIYVWIAEAVDYKGNIIQRKGTVLVVR